MDALIGGMALLVVVLGFGPATRGTKAAFDAFDDPGKPDTPAERERANSDLVRLFVLLVALCGLMFVWKLGGA